MQKAIDILKKYTKHNDVRLTNRGNTAILAALYIAKKVNSKAFLLIPDQGGWKTYKTFPRIFGFEIKEVKTDNGIIDLEDLEEKAPKGSAFIFPSFAGYFAEQPLEEISKICRKNNCLVIEDASGSIGDDNLCNGDYSDIIIGSFGKYKPVELGGGGFISVKKAEYFEKAKEIFPAITFFGDCEKLFEKLSNVQERLKFFFEKAEKIKKDLEKFEILHRMRRGINVAVKFNTDNEKQGIIDYCKKNSLEYLLCPKYFRVNCDAVSIEVKRLE